VAAKKPVDARARTLAVADSVAAKLWRRYRTTMFEVYSICAMVVFVILAVIAKTWAYSAFDVKITHAVQTFHAGWFDALMRAVTWIGFLPQGVLIAAGILLLLYTLGLKWEMVMTGASVLGGSALGLGLKVLIARPRPSAHLVTVIKQLGDNSFPSGHVLFFTTLFGFVFFLAYTLLKHSWWRTLLLVLLLGLVGMIGPSRIYVGEHWASDVVAAYLLGSVWLALSMLVYRRGKQNGGLRFSRHRDETRRTPEMQNRGAKRGEATTRRKPEKKKGQRLFSRSGMRPPPGAICAASCWPTSSAKPS
jgi:membrane-associated phospholipid phosphatase